MRPTASLSSCFTRPACALALVSVLCLLAGCGSRDWRALTMQDVDSAYQALLEHHPGVVDPEHPEFEERLGALYLGAKERAAQVDDFGGYLYALRYLTVGLHDEHIGIGLYEAPDRQQAWPGFAVTWDADTEEMVVFRRDDESAPPVGAVLAACDGQDVDELVATRVAPYIGNWKLAAKRTGDAPFVLIDSDNPFVENPKSCVFTWDGEPHDVALVWREATRELIRELLDEVEPRVETTTGVRRLEDGTVWITVSSFDVSQPETKTAVSELIRDVESLGDELAAAPALVADVRGNGGGSSGAAAEIASAIWGAAEVDRVRPRVERVDWRASEGNLVMLEQFLPAIAEAFGEDSLEVRELTAVREAMADAVASGKPYAQLPKVYPDAPADAHSNAGGRAVPERQFLLTDATCVSACLDFADIALHIPGVEQIGHETAGDTLYLDIRAEPLPSKVAQISFSVAAHRGRVRADNESHVPNHAWTGRIDDTASLESWVSELSQEARDPGPVGDGAIETETTETETETTETPEDAAPIS